MIRKLIYKDVCDRLRLAGIAHVSMWNNNTEMLEENASFRLPAVFVEFEDMEWIQGGGGAYRANITVILHIITESLADPSDGSPYQDEALSTFSTITDVCNAIEGKGGNCYNKMVRKTSHLDHNHGQILHSMETFVCMGQL